MDTYTMRHPAEDVQHQSPAAERPALVDPRLLIERIDWNLQRADIRRNHRALLLMVGVDNLWVYEDCRGTQVADQVLMVVAESIIHALSPSPQNLSADGDSEDTHVLAAHMGGDVLAVLLEGGAAAENGSHAARMIRQALHGLNPAPTLDAFATATLGVVDIRDGHQVHENARQALRDAQAAMLHARTRGRGWSCVFQPDLRRSAANRLKLECDLRRAVNNREFRLVYQPIIELESGALTGFEALLRWQTPDGSFVSPADFIPLAEETGLVWPIGEFVLDTACRQLAEWRSGRRIAMNVNVSRRQFSEEGLTDLVPAVMKRHGVSPETLVLEITESTLLHDTASVVQIMNSLTESGVALHLDDFGTGYSSLGSLHQFPVKGLKVDRSFVVRASGRRDYAAVLHAIVALAENLRLDVVGEGIETHEQLALLQSLNCPRGQGYLFGKPMSEDAAAELLCKGSLLPR